MMRVSLVTFLLPFIALATAPLAVAQLMDVRDTDRILEIMVDANGCRGDCPVYKVTFRCTAEYTPECAATYEGRKGVALIGRYESKIAASVFRELAGEVERLGYFKLVSRYGAGKFDAYIVSVGVSTGRRRKVVTAYDTGAAPAEFRCMQKAVEDEVAKLKWEKRTGL